MLLDVFGMLANRCVHTYAVHALLDSIASLNKALMLPSCACNEHVEETNSLARHLQFKARKACSHT
jgi:hypothetical protein